MTATIKEVDLLTPAVRRVVAAHTLLSSPAYDPGNYWLQFARPCDDGCSYERTEKWPELIKQLWLGDSSLVERNEAYASKLEQEIARIERERASAAKA